MINVINLNYKTKQETTETPAPMSSTMLFREAGVIAEMLKYQYTVIRYYTYNLE